MVTPTQVLRIVGKALVAGIALMVVVALVAGGLVAGGVVEVGQPQVVSVSNEWGAVTQESTQLQTQVVMNNPNAVGVPGLLDVEYRATMNDVVIVEGHRGDVGLPSGESTLDIAAQMDNDRIADWWVAHVNDGERSDLSITAAVDGPLGVSKTVPVTETTFETDLLGHLSAAEPTNISMGGEQLLRVSGQDATWGEADEAETPVVFSAAVENTHDSSITIDGFGYEVAMNDVIVGSGETPAGVEIASGSTERVDVRAIIDTPKMADWWASHVRNGESTNLSVAVWGFVDRDGERKRLPLNLVDQKVRFSTDFLAGGNVEVQPIETSQEPPQVEQPTLTGTDSEWGDVSDDVTEVRTDFGMDNPNDESVSDQLVVEVGQTTTINDVVVASDRTVVDSIRPGENQLTHVATMDNNLVPEWWARHINRGETSTFVTTPDVTVDAGFTTFDVELPERSSTMETDMLSALEQSETQTWKVSGVTVATAHEVTAEWGEATTEHAPIVIEATIENHASTDLTIRFLDFGMELNGVVVADDRADQSYTIAPGETRTVEFVVYKDVSKMDEWWVTHVRNDETTTASFEAFVTVEAAGETDRMQLLDGEETVETDLLGDDGARVAPAVVVV